MCVDDGWAHPELSEGDLCFSWSLHHTIEEPKRILQPDNLLDLRHNPLIHKVTTFYRALLCKRLKRYHPA